MSRRARGTLSSLHGARPSSLINRPHPRSGKKLSRTLDFFLYHGPVRHRLVCQRSVYVSKQFPAGNGTAPCRAADFDVRPAFCSAFLFLASCWMLCGTGRFLLDVFSDLFCELSRLSLDAGLPIHRAACHAPHTHFVRC